MQVIKPEDLENKLKNYIHEINSTDEAINQIIKYFHEFKVIEKLDFEEQDMILFQYGIHDFGEGHGKEFDFDLTRQIILPNDEGLIQLSLTLYFDATKMNKLDSFNIWSSEYTNFDKWQNQIKKTEGYKISANQKPKRFVVQFCYV